MVNFYNNLPASTKLVLHGVFAILTSGVVTGGEAAYQSFTQSGHLNPPALLVTAWSAFLLYLIPAMYAYVPAHAAQLIKSIQDEKTAMYEALQRSQNVTSAVIATQGKQVQSSPVQQPVAVIHAPSLIKSEDIQSIAAQLAVNLINIAADRASQAVASTTPAAPTPAPVAPSTPAPDPYVDPLRNSAVLPAYSPPIPDQATQVVPQVPFTV